MVNGEKSEDELGGKPKNESGCPRKRHWVFFRARCARRGSIPTMSGSVSGPGCNSPGRLGQLQGSVFADDGKAFRKPGLEVGGSLEDVDVRRPKRRRHLRVSAPSVPQHVPDSGDRFWHAPVLSHSGALWIIVGSIATIVAPEPKAIDYLGEVLVICAVVFCGCPQANFV